jgi:hypothetical protein
MTRKNTNKAKKDRDPQDYEPLISTTGKNQNSNTAAIRIMRKARRTKIDLRKYGFIRWKLYNSTTLGQ